MFAGQMCVLPVGAFTARSVEPQGVPGLHVSGTSDLEYARLFTREDMLSLEELCHADFHHALVDDMPWPIVQVRWDILTVSSVQRVETDILLYVPE